MSFFHKRFKTSVGTKRAALILVYVSITVVGFQNCGDFMASAPSDLSSIFSSSSDSASVGQVRRLSKVEYQNSLYDVVKAQFTAQNSNNSWMVNVYDSASVRNSLSAMPADGTATKLGTPELAMDVSEDLFGGYNSAAVAISSAIVANGWIPQFTGCANDSIIATSSCSDKFIMQFATFAFRTPPTDSERAELKTATDWTTLIAKVLTHPRFLTHLERDGTRRADGSYQLTPYEIESRLASVFTKSAPDAVGIQAAASGSLATPAGIRTEAARLFAKGRSHDVMWNFYRQWLGEKRLPYTYGSNDAVYTTFSAPVANADMNAYPGALRNAVIDDARQFLDYHTFNAGSLQDVFRSPLIFTTNSMVATFYGITPRASGSAPPVTDPSGHYLGILSRQYVTQQDPGVAEGDTNHIQRGVLILTNLVGQSLGLPSPGALQAAAAANILESVSTRVAQETQTSAGACMSCHQMINPAGFAMAHYDSLGRYMTTENRYRLDKGAAKIVGTNPIDSTANIQLGSKFYFVTDLPGLVDALFTSGALYQGFAKYYFTYAFGRVPSNSIDMQIITSLTNDLKKGSISDALLNMTQLPAFGIAAPPMDN